MGVLVLEMPGPMADLAIAAMKALRPSGRAGQAMMIACRSASGRKESGKSVPDDVPRSGKMRGFPEEIGDRSTPAGGA